MIVGENKQNDLVQLESFVKTPKLNGFFANAGVT
jgi:hypothetical protein